MNTARTETGAGSLSNPLHKGVVSGSTQTPLIGSTQRNKRFGVFQPLYDGQVNIPDIFRVGYGLGRRGGVKPAR